MKYIFAFLCTVWSLLPIYTFGQQKYPFMDKTLSTEKRVNDLIARMTMEEKIDLLSGYNDFYLHPCERLGIPAFKLADGPLGVASWGLFGRATAFPSALSLASSWNTELAKKTGEIFAQEWRARGIHFLLGPGVNNYRASKGARNFEYFGEDPYLSSEMIVPYIKAVQEGGVIATIKHYVANDQEFDRYTVSTEVSERALQEIYLPPFKAAVQKADVKAVMTGYNLVNGIYCTENKHLIDILKKDWKFKGILMSDWACTYSAKNAANNGLDLEMGSKDWFNQKELLPLIKSGEVSENTINDKIKRIYGSCISMGFFDRPQKETSIPIFNPKANKIAFEIASEGIILLKNEQNILPIKKPKIIAIIGPTANPAIIVDRAHNVNGTVYGGGGSSKVHPWYIINALEGISQEFPQATILYNEGISNQFKSKLFRNSKFRTKDFKEGLDAEYYALRSDSSNIVSNKLLQQQAIAAGRTVTNNQAEKSFTTTTNNKGLIIKERERSVDFEWWGKPHNNAQLGENYTVKWDGYIDAEKTDSLRFFVDAQGGYRLWVDDQLKIDASLSQSFNNSNCSLAVNKGQVVHIHLEYNNQLCLPAEIRFGYSYQSDIDFSEAKRIASLADIVVFCAGLDGSIELEGRDRPFELPYGQDLLINELVKINPKLVVAIHAGGSIQMAPWIDKVAAVVHALYPGQEGGRALAKVLSGEINPSAKLPFSIEKYWKDSPAYGNYDETRREKKVYYNEGVFTGYRGYERNNIEPLFPFGFGLSYTKFSYSDIKIDIEDIKQKKITVSFKLKNTGDKEGSEIAQLYVTDIKSKEERPLKELKGFKKVRLLPGESKIVEIELNKDAFSYYNSKQNRWVFENGDFEILIGASSKDIKLKQKITL